MQDPRTASGPAALLLVLVLATGAAADVVTIPVSEIQPGMTGYGLTVFAGSTVDTFGVTVVGVQRNIRADGSLIVVEVSGHGLEVSSIAQGMSGSPVFLDGRLAGALAFGWAGALRPLGGVTPADEMLAVSAAPPATYSAGGGTAPSWGQLVPAPSAHLLHRLDWPTTPAADPAAPALPAGWPAAEDLASALLAPLLGDDPAPTGWVCRPAGGTAEAGRSAPDPHATLVPGGACAVPLIMGDAQLGAIGTVTWVEGDDVWMMGHPFMQRGPVRLPLATAEILTMFPSRQMSFKMGSIGTLVGAVHQDRRPAVVGRLGAEAPLLPVTVAVHDAAGTRDYAYRVADDPLLAGSLVFWAAYNSLLAEGDDASLQTVHWSLDLLWRAEDEDRQRRLVLDGAGAGPGGAASLGAGLMIPLNLLLANPFTPVRFDSVAVTLTATPGLEMAQVLGASAPRRVPVGTRSLPVQVDLEPRRGERRTVTVDLALPAGLEPGRHRLVIASAAEFFGLEVQRAAGRFTVPDLAATEALLVEERGATVLTTALLVRGRNVVVRGRELDALPGSVRRTVRRGVGNDGRTLADFVARDDTPLPWLLQGNAVLELEVTATAEPLDPERRP
jgi:hypothetical protein